MSARLAGSDGYKASGTRSECPPQEAVRETILIVDDDADIRTTLAMVLQSAGYATREADNGSAGIEEALASKPALVLLDLFMPGADGRQFLERRRGNDELRKMPVVIISSTARGAPLFGTEGYLEKPFDGETLLTEVERTIAAVR